MLCYTAVRLFAFLFAISPSKSVGSDFPIVFPGSSSFFTLVFSMNLSSGGGQIPLVVVLYWLISSLFGACDEADYCWWS